MQYGQFPLYLGLLLVFGCQTTLPDPGDGTPFRAEMRNHPHATEGFAVKAKRFFEPLLPDTGRPGDVSTASRRPVPDPGSAIVADPTTFYVSGGSSRSGKVRPSDMIFDFGFLDGPATEQTVESEDASPAQTTQHAAAQEKTTPNKMNVLQAQSDDSKPFQRLLREIAATPPEERKVDETELEKRLTVFRESVCEESDPEFEQYCLAILRKGILPDRRPQTESDLPEPPRRKIGREKTESEWAFDDMEQNPGSTEEMSDAVSDAVSDATSDRSLPAPLPLRKSKEFPSGSGSKELARAPKPLPSKQSSKDPRVVQASYKASYADRKISDHTVRNAVRNDDEEEAFEEPDHDLWGEDWETPIRIAVERLRERILQNPDEHTFSNEGRLRLLELSLGNRNEAVRPFTSAEKTFNESWGNLMLGFSTLLDDVDSSEPQARIVQAAFRFDEASKGLNRFCPLKLKNVQLVKDWVTFGVFLPCNDDCQAGEEIGLYMELDHPTIRKSAQGYNVRASVGYEIRDSAANVVQKNDRIPVEETTPSQKRDYCIFLKVRLPQSLPHGQYQLRLCVTDMNSDSLQYAEEQIPIRVVPASPIPN